MAAAITWIRGSARCTFPLEVVLGGVATIWRFGWSLTRSPVINTGVGRSRWS